MPLCQACGQNDAIFHITLNVNIFGPKSVRSKVVQFIVCDACDVRLQQVFCRDVFLKERIAVRLTVNPEFKSETIKAWNHLLRNYQPISE